MRNNNICNDKGMKDADKNFMYYLMNKKKCDGNLSKLSVSGKPQDMGGNMDGEGWKDKCNEDS